MKKLTIIFFIGSGAAIFGQTPPPGTITVGPPTPITAVAGTANCVFNLTASSLSVTCTNSVLAVTSTNSVPLPVLAPGTIGTYVVPIAGATPPAANVINWQIQPWATPGSPQASACPAGSTGGTCWMVVANGVSKQGVF